MQIAAYRLENGIIIPTKTNAPKTAEFTHIMISYVPTSSSAEAEVGDGDGEGVGETGSLWRVAAGQ